MANSQAELVELRNRAPDWFHVGKYTPAGQIRAVLRGAHPLGAPLKLGKTCGDCRHCVSRQHHIKRYVKCDLVETRGAATDIRRKWPACTLFEKALTAATRRTEDRDG